MCMWLTLLNLANHLEEWWVFGVLTWVGPPTFHPSVGRLTGTLCAIGSWIVNSLFHWAVYLNGIIRVWYGGFFFLYKYDPINTRALLHTCWSRSTNPSVPDLQRLYVCHLLGRWHQCQGQAHKRSSSCWLNEGFVVVRDVKVWMGEGLRAGGGGESEEGAGLCKHELTSACPRL